MSGTSPPHNRIVPVMAGKKPSSASSRNGSRCLRQQVLKGEAVGTEALRIQCLEELRLYAAPIKGDGNCLFYSLSDQLYGHPDCHEEIRQRLVEHVRDKSDYFMQFVSDVGGERRAPRRAAAVAAAKARRSNDGGSIGRLATDDGQRAKFEQMLSQMGKNGFWGGSVELQAFCQAYEKDIRVYTDYGVQTFTSDATSDPQEEKEVIHVAYHSFEHYSSIRSIDGPHTGLPNLPNGLGKDLGERKKVGREKSDTDSSAGESSEPLSEASSNNTPLTMAEPWKISSIAEALPEFDHETIRTMLTKCRGDIDNAFSKLLDGDISTLSFDKNTNNNIKSSSSSPNTLPPLPSSSTPDTSQSSNAERGTPSKAFLGSSSRSSSRHSTASKRSADQSDDDDEGGPIRSANRPRRGRDRKRRVLQDVTVGISVRGEDDNDVISIRLRVDPNTVAEQADGAPPSAQSRGGASPTEEAEPSEENTQESSVSVAAENQTSVTVSDEDDSGYGEPR